MCRRQRFLLRGGFKPGSEAALISWRAERAQRTTFNLQSACFRFVRFLNIHFCRRVICKENI